ncbi:MAG: hypothetical protein GXO36_02015 [Chloroflexi bacterium]|nr:hypothetical protein [Chloroflexota bacterium]
MADSPRRKAVPVLVWPTLVTALFMLGLGLHLSVQAATSEWEVRVHPTGGLFVGDQVTWIVFAPRGQGRPGEEVTLRLEHGKVACEWRGKLSPFGMERRLAAVLPWAWDTREGPAQPGTYTLRVYYRGREQTRVPITLAPADQRPWWEQGVTWHRWDTSCCHMYGLTRTETERDAAQLQRMLQTAWDELIHRLPPRTDAQPEIVFIPRLWGQGGFAQRHVLWLSYLDRSPTGSDPSVLIRHELIHWLDTARPRESLLVEGLAVYLSGGHYHPEPLLDRAAALLPLQMYIPLPKLAVNFYQHQHEIAYLEAGALVAYMVDRWGWDAFWSFYQTCCPTRTSARMANTAQIQIYRHVEGKDAAGLVASPAPRATTASQAPPTATDAEASSLQVIVLYDRTALGRVFAQQATATPTTDLDRALQTAFGLTLAELDQDFQAALRARDEAGRRWMADVRLTVEHFDLLRRYQQVLDPSAYYAQVWLPPWPEVMQRGAIADVYRQPESTTALTITLLLQASAAARARGEVEQAQTLLREGAQTLDRAARGHPRPWEGGPLARQIAQWVDAARACGWRVQRMERIGTTWQMAVWRPETYPQLETVHGLDLLLCPRHPWGEPEGRLFVGELGPGLGR